MPQHITIPAADIEIDLASGEEIRIEISTKFTQHTLHEELEAVGLEIQRIWTDPTDSFAVTLASKVA